LIQLKPPAPGCAGRWLHTENPMSSNMQSSKTLTLTLPPQFLSLCATHGVEPETVIRGFIADLCHLRTAEYHTNGSDERNLADDYYQRVGYAHWREAEEDACDEEE
jgi:hypothetical protein